MASEPIHINDDSELPRLLDEAAERPVRFERKGVVYRVSIEESWVAVRKGLEMIAFCWDEVDPDLVEERYQAALRAGLVKTLVTEDIGVKTVILS